MIVYIYHIRNMNIMQKKNNPNDIAVIIKSLQQLRLVSCIK